ncbi:hypothetical protein PA08_0719 [Cutibacterium modestum P08]|nr:hypothetical protein PA08_0719 [Cutibacterium modestum P08]
MGAVIWWALWFDGAGVDGSDVEGAGELSVEEFVPFGWALSWEFSGLETMAVVASFCWSLTSIRSPLTVTEKRDSPTLSTLMSYVVSCTVTM